MLKINLSYNNRISIAPYGRDIRGAGTGDLPRVASRQRGGRESNPRFVDRLSEEP